MLVAVTPANHHCDWILIPCILLSIVLLSGLNPFFDEEQGIAAYRKAHRGVIDLYEHQQSVLWKLAERRAREPWIECDTLLMAEFDSVPDTEYAGIMWFDLGLVNEYMEITHRRRGQDGDWAGAWLPLLTTQRWGLREQKLIWAMLLEVPYGKEDEYALQKLRLEEAAGRDPSRLAAMGWALTHSHQSDAIRVCKKALELSETDRDRDRARFYLFEAYTVDGEWERALGLWPEVKRYIPIEQHSARLQEMQDYRRRD